MAQIEPFRAIRYSRRDLTGLIAPPYDILDEDDKATLLGENEYNIVAIDLPHVPPKTAGPPAVYRTAASTLMQWLDVQTVQREKAPAIYVYHQTYEAGGKTLTRKKFFARLRLEEFGEGSVFAHEQTFGGPKEDRLMLTGATKCNTSPIFGLYPDAENSVSAMLDEAIERAPDQSGELDGVRNNLWVVSNAATIKQVQSMLRDKPIFIADGHHRYGTALMYRQSQLDEIGALSTDDPANFVLAVLGGMEDPGATIRPYFRTIANLPAVTANDWQSALSDAFDWKAVATPSSDEALAAALAAARPGAMALYIAKDEATAIIAPKDRDLLARYEPKRHAAWRAHPYAVLHRYIIEEIVRKRFNKGGDATVHYHKSMDEAIDDADATKGVAALMPATTMDELRDICTAGELMPQKSTYFHPKLATGMVMNPLY